MLTKNSTIDLKNGTQIRKKQTPQSSSSYTYHTYNPNRLSSYDNDIYEYNTNQQRQTDLETIFKKTQMSNNQRASIAVPNTKQSNIHLLKSCVNSSNVSSSSNKTNSSSNLFTRAFNYAFKKNDSTTKLSWKSKLGKFFPQSTSNRKLNINNKEEGCDIVIDDDLYESATYHLSRRNPIKKQSLNDNLISTCSPLNNENSNNNLLCLTTANNSSSVFSTSFDNTPYSSNQTSQKKSSSSSRKSNRAKCLEKTSSSTMNLNRSSPCLQKETNNKSIINNGFNSLRKILKISNVSTANKPVQKQHKCSSASSTPLPPSMKLNSFDKLKETKIINNSPINQIRSSLSSSNASIMPSSKQQHHIKADADSAASNSRYSISKHGTNLTKSIINQTSSTFSSYSASLSSSLSNDATSNKSKSNIIGK